MSTIYHSAAVRVAVAGERKRLRAHRPVPGSERCAACGRATPCEDATAALDFLTERGFTAVPDAPEGRFRLLRRRAA